MSPNPHFRPGKAVAVLAAFSAALFFLYHRTVSVDPARHAEFTGKIRRLQQLDATLSDLVLETRHGYLGHYDSVVATMEQSRAVRSSLTLERASVFGRDRERLQTSLLALDATMELKAHAIEKFKMHNAILSNSLLYYPKAMDTALSESSAAAREKIDALLVQAIRYLSRPEAPLAIRERIEAIRAAGHDEIPGVAVLVTHTEKLVFFKQATDRSIESILGIATQAGLRDLEAIVNNGYGDVVRTAQRSRIYLYSLSTLLVVFGVRMLVGLIRASRQLQTANEELERRVAERTTELRNKNADLQHEVLERQQAEESLLEKNRELDEFTYVASHDLQEPLRKLISFSEMLKTDVGDDLPERAEEDIHYITGAARRMQNLVQDLLALSRAGKSAMADEEVELDVCVDAALEALDTRLEETQAEIVRDTLPCVRGDRSMLTQLFQNLVGNAVKFTRPGVRPVVRINATIDPEGIATIAVEDNGIGMKSQYLEKIFAPFKRLHGRGEYEGTGIGLAICQKFVSRHGSRLYVESELGQGSIFKFTMVPVTPLRANDESEREPHESYHPVG